MKVDMNHRKLKVDGQRTAEGEKSLSIGADVFVHKRELIELNRSFQGFLEYSEVAEGWHQDKRVGEKA